MYKKIDSFYNCIDMGDLIYSLLFCKILNVRKMYIDGGCNTVKFNWNAAKFLLPLVQSQEYLETVELYKDQEYDWEYLGRSDSTDWDHSPEAVLTKMNKPEQQLTTTNQNDKKWTSINDIEQKWKINKQ